MIVGRHRQRHAHVAVDEAAHRRPVLQQEERAEDREREEEDQRRQPLDPLRQPLEQGRPGIGDAALRVLRRAGRLVDPGVVDPALHLVDGLGDARLDLGRLLGDPAEDEQEDDHAERDEPEQDEDGTGDSWHAVRCSLVTAGPATVARMAPTSTGSTIVDVSPSSQISPTRTRPTPTRNQASSPRSRSHIGAEKTRESDVASILTTVSSGAQSRSVGLVLPRRNRSKSPPILTARILSFVVDDAVRVGWTRDLAPLPACEALHVPRHDRGRLGRVCR